MAKTRKNTKRTAKKYNSSKSFSIFGRRITKFHVAGLLAVILFAAVGTYLLLPSKATYYNLAKGVNAGSNLYDSAYGQSTDALAMQRAGVTWARVDTFWVETEKEGPGQYKWAGLDSQVYYLRSRGINVLMVNSTVPYWASADPNKYTSADGVRHWNVHYKPKNFSLYGNYMSALAAHYKGQGVNAFEIWNEEDLSTFWPSGPSTTEYTAMLAAAYPAIKSVHPGATVILGGLRQNNYPFLAEVYRLGGKAYFNAVATHVYPGGSYVDPRTCVKVDNRFQRDALCGILEVRNTMVANGDGGKNLWVTEFGWSTGKVLPDTQAAYARDGYAAMRNWGPYIVPFWYKDRETTTPSAVENGFGLTTPTFAAKPAFWAYQRANTMPLFDFYSSTYYDHIYTTNYNYTSSTFTKVNGGAPIAYIYLSTDRPTGTVPLYESYNSSASDHLYTTSYAEATSPGYGNVRVIGHIYPNLTSQQSYGSQALYRFHRNSPYSHYMSVNPTAYTGYYRDGVIGYVFANWR